MRILHALGAFLASMMGHWAAAQVAPYRSILLGNEEPHPAIQAIEQDAMGRLWLATEGQGVVVYAGEVLRKFGLADGLPNAFVRDLEWDARGNLWAGTESGVAYFNGMRWKVPEGPSLASNRINALVADGEQMWMLCRAGVYVAIDSAYQLVSSSSNNTAGVLRGDSLYWLSERGWEAMHRTQFSSASPRQLPGIQSLAVYRDTLWGAGAQGTWAVFPRGTKATGSAVAVWSFANQGSVWVSQSSIRAEPSGTVWLRQPTVLNPRAYFPAADGGVYEAVGVELRYYPPVQIARYGSPASSEVWAVSRFENQWLVAESNGVYRETSGGFKAIPGLSGLVFSMAETPGGLLLAGEQGLWNLPPGSNSKATSLASGFFTQLVPYEGAWLAVGPDGVVSNVNGQWQLDGRFPAGVLHVNHGPEGLIFLGVDGQAYTMGTQGAAVATWKIPDTLEVVDAVIWKGQPLWATRAEGLWYKGKPWPAPGALPGEIISVLWHREHLWVQSSHAIYRLNLSDQPRCDFAWKEGSGLGNFTAKGMHIDQAGHLRLALSNGWLDLATQAIVPERFQASIAGLDIFARAAQTGEGTAKWTFLPTDLQLGYAENYLRFRITGVTPIPAEMPVFFYRLKGLETEWNRSTTGEAFYPNLPHGTFTFEVALADPLGLPGEVQTLVLAIAPPIWKTVWFWVLVVMALALMVYAYLRWRILAVERRAALERDLAEMERRALGLQMNPHFTFNALDSISSFIFKNDQKSAVRYLTSFAKLMRSTLEASREHFIPLQTEVGIIKHYADLEGLRFSEPLDFQIEVDDDILFEALIPPMLVQPLVENAIKHGLRGLDRTPVLRVRFERVDDHLVVEVEDNGRGRDAAEQRDKGDHRSVGSTILERRLQLIGQAEKVRAQIRYEDLKTEGVPSGTKAILVLPYRKDHPGD